jgi:hypothetical protein
MHRHLRAAALAALLALAAGPALAQDRPLLATSKDNWPTELTRRPLTLGAGMFELYVPVAINMSKGDVGKPVTSNPSLYFGLTDRWMLGVRHLVGLCLSGTSNGCTHTYNDVSVDTVVSLARSSGLDLAIGAAVNWAPLHGDAGLPSAWSGEGRVIVRAGGGAVGLTVAPTLNFGLNDRDRATKWAATTFNLGTYDLVSVEPSVDNKEFLTVPATLQIQLGPSLALAAGASLDGPLDTTGVSFSDAYRIPVSAALVVTPIPWVDLGASFTFTNLLGKGHSADFRALGIFGAFRI